MTVTRVVNGALLPSPPEAVFAFVTTGANWVRWHPSSVAVRGQAAEPGVLGDKIEEDFLVAGRTGTVVWTVTEFSPPRRWVIDGVIVGRDVGGRVEYDLDTAGPHTRFERQFSYQVPWRYILADRLVVRRRVVRESAEAVRRLEELVATGI